MPDAIDRQLLGQLAADGSLTSQQLSERVGLSPSAAHRRVKLLEQAGLIRGYRAVLSDEARGHPAIVLVAVTLRDQRRETLDRFETALESCREVTECQLMGGEADYILRLEVPRDDSFERLHRDVLSKLPGVQRLVSQFCIRTVFRRD